MITPISGDSEQLFEGSRWVLVVRVTDDDGRDVSSAPSISAVLPDGSTESATVEDLGQGFYRAGFTVTDAGWYTATAIAAGYGVTAFRANVISLADPFANMPDLADIKTYLGTSPSTADATIVDALNAETQAQMDCCRIPVVYPVTLGQALKRRVARNLALRGIPLAVLQGDAESGSLTLPGSDPEVRRLEKPYRKLVQP